MDRCILHVDQNCYFASVEMIDHPEYRNVPMAVVGDASQRHGIILAKNQLASKAGVKTAEAIWQAERKCPNLVTVLANHDKYIMYSNMLRDMYEEYTDKVEPFGLDECWLDITDSLMGRTSEEIAEEIRWRVKQEFNLTCSIGVSFNKIFAKLGSDYKKPDAVTVIRRDNFKDIVWPLPVDDLLFVGRNTGERLRKVNIKTIGDLANSDRNFICNYMGKNGEGLWLYANGLDESPVKNINYSREIKSIGNSCTTPVDMVNMREVSGTFKELSEQVARRLRKKHLLGSSVQITVRDSKLNIFERQRSLFEPTNSGKVIFDTAMELFAESCEADFALRSIGVRTTKLIPDDSLLQLSIFDEGMQKKAKNSKVNDIVDKINNLYGKGSVRTLGELNSVEYNEERSDENK
ncbi:MAG: DNA polymerase IV [Clostridia bacterium]|nr:DNA polymerase IV [Clostridia bacterium]